MKKGRLEAFTDGVLAIVITIMVLELKVPHGGDFESLTPLLPVFGSYVLSFIYIAIYWNNHHHMLQTVHRVSGQILWANMHLLFWLSLIPFVTGWMGENEFTQATVFMYGMVLLACAIAYFILQRAILHHHESDFVLRKALGKDYKGKISPFFYIAGIIVSFYNVWISFAFYILVAIIWLVPDKRIEKALINSND
ncbi:TMEM175 family protein [Psychroserpens sp.]|uniref:TMEM175 family protein n=1 Tax=Psychroserpens sp. TaxID=2020870 RepID=UPI003C76D090